MGWDGMTWASGSSLMQRGQPNSYPSSRCSLLGGETGGLAWDMAILAIDHERRLAGWARPPSTRLLLESPRATYQRAASVAPDARPPGQPAATVFACLYNSLPGPDDLTAMSFSLGIGYPARSTEPRYPFVPTPRHCHCHCHHLSCRALLGCGYRTCLVWSERRVV